MDPAWRRAQATDQPSCLVSAHLQPPLLSPESWAPALLSYSRSINTGGCPAARPSPEQLAATGVQHVSALASRLQPCPSGTVITGNMSYSATDCHHPKLPATWQIGTEMNLLSGLFFFSRMWNIFALLSWTFRSARQQKFESCLFSD